LNPQYDEIDVMTETNIILGLSNCIIGVLMILLCIPLKKGIVKMNMLYGKRWGIETSYKVKKHSFLPKTTSKNYLIRIFYFLFSVLLYNLWLLADILIWLALFGEVKQDHLITSKYFGTILYTIDPGGG